MTENKDSQYQKEDRELQEKQNLLILENTRVTRIVLVLTIIATVAAIVGAIAESVQAWFR